MIDEDSMPLNKHLKGASMFESELKLLMNKYGIDGVMYGMEIDGLTESFSYGKNVRSTYGDRPYICLNTFINEDLSDGE